MNIPVLVLALFECLAVGWFFGTDNMSKAIEDMQGSKPSIFFTLCWKYISPFLLIVIFCVTFVQNMMGAPDYPTFIGCDEVRCKNVALKCFTGVLLIVYVILSFMLMVFTNINF